MFIYDCVVMVPTVRESRKNKEKSENFTFHKLGKNKRVRGSQGKSKYHGAKAKDAEKIWNCFTQTAYNSSPFFSARFAHRLFVFPVSNLFHRL